MPTAATAPSAAPVVLRDIDDLAAADLDALLADALTVRPVDARELAGAVVRAGGLALEAHALDCRAETFLDRS
jgi:hypothetical protein